MTKNQRVAGRFPERRYFDAAARRKESPSFARIGRLKRAPPWKATLLDAVTFREGVGVHGGFDFLGAQVGGGAAHGTHQIAGLAASGVVEAGGGVLHFLDAVALELVDGGVEFGALFDGGLALGGEECAVL